MSFDLRRGDNGVIIRRVSVRAIVSHVSCSFDFSDATGRLDVTVSDSMTQERVGFSVPVSAVPGLAAGLADLVRLYPNKFPDVMLHRFE